jgi:hypothetical protein
MREYGQQVQCVARGCDVMFKWTPKQEEERGAYCAECHSSCNKSSYMARAKHKPPLSIEEEILKRRVQSEMQEDDTVHLNLTVPSKYYEKD